MESAEGFGGGGTLPVWEPWAIRKRTTQKDKYLQGIGEDRKGKVNGGKKKKP